MSKQRIISDYIMRRNRWRCSHCGTCGWGRMPPHDRPEGKSCRMSGQKSEREIKKTFVPSISKPLHDVQ